MNTIFSEDFNVIIALKQLLDLPHIVRVFCFENREPVD